MVFQNCVYFELREIHFKPESTEKNFTLLYHCVGEMSGVCVKSNLFFRLIRQLSAQTKCVLYY